MADKNPSNDKSNREQIANPIASKNSEVLYQKMGNRWFAFSVVDGEVFMGSISQEEIDRLEASTSIDTFAINGNS